MSEFDREDEELEVEVELYATDDDEDVAVGNEGLKGQIDAYVEDVDDEYDLVIDDLGSDEPEPEQAPASNGSPYANVTFSEAREETSYELNNRTDAESFDPDEAPANAVVGADDVGSALVESISIAAGEEVDELPESIEIPMEDNFVYVEKVSHSGVDKAARSRRRLRNVLIFFIIVLVILGAAIGVFVWRNNTPPDIKQTDPDAMQTSQAGTNVEVFQTIDAAQIPDLVTFFSLTPEEAAEKSGGAISLDAESKPTTDTALPEVKSVRNGWVVGTSGDIAVSITFGLDADGKIIYTLATFDLDAYGVADAKFDELIASRTIAASILAGVGLDAATVDSANLTLVQKPDAITSRDTAGKEIAEFSGPTNLDHAPREYKLTETYDHTAGASLGDNSVIRTLSVDLR